jgi:hypothetical protein
MATQKIVWTVLPKGNHDGTLKVSIYMSPRLTPSGVVGRLKEFPDFWNPGAGHWPGKIGGKPFTLEFKTGGSTVQVQAKPVGIKPDPKLWGVLFNENTTVRPFQFSDYSQRFIHSYPVRTVVNYVKGIYGTMAESLPTSFPPLSRGKDDTGLPDLRGLIETVGPIGGSRLSARGNGWNPADRFKGEKRKAVDAGAFSSFGFTSQEQLAFTEVKRFYQRPHPNNKYREAASSNMHDIPKRLDTPKPDFHQMLSALGDYPQLMRMLGVVIDFEIVADGGIGQLLGASAVRVKPQAPTDYSPWTRLIKDFLAEPRPDLADLDAGLLRIDNHDMYDLIQVDVDAVGLKTLQFASNMMAVGIGKGATPPTVSYAVPDEASLPSIRTSGMAIAKYNRAFKMTDRLDKQAQLNAALASNADSFLYADDLVRGYRVDVLDTASGRWRSLCQRIGNFVFPGSGHDPLRIAEEGYVKGASTTATKEGTPDDQELYLHENIFQWDGWSLSASRPGKTIVQKTYDASGNALPHPTEEVEVPKNTAVTEFKMEVDMRPAPGTLPRLRFGREYRMRARAVDLAGNSIPLDPPSSWKDAALVDIAAPKRDHVSEKLIYGRFEPVPSPVLVPLKAFGEGESVENMVIRSNYDVSADAYGGQPQVTSALAGRWYVYAGISERHVAPPKSSQIAAETHGMFESGIGKGNPHEAAYNISLKEEGTFFDRQIVDTATGAKTITADGVALVTPPMPPGTKTAVLDGDPVGANQYVLKPGDTVAPGQYVIHDTPKLLLPYLPDPIARGAALLGLPKVTATGSIAGGLEKAKVSTGFGPDQYVVKVPFDGDWPDARPFRIRLAEGDAEPEWKGGDDRVLVVSLPKGRMAHILYSSYIGKDPVSGRPDYELMGISRWVSNPAAQIAPFAEKGSHWMLTPHRPLTLVHAVQQPLDEPKFTKSQVKKWKIGDTYVDIYGFLDLDVPSSGSVEVIADWFDPLDVLTADKPEDDPSASNRKSNVFKMEIDYDAPDPTPIHSPDIDKMNVPLSYFSSYVGVDLPPDGGGDAAKLPAESKGALIDKQMEMELAKSGAGKGMKVSDAAKMKAGIGKTEIVKADDAKSKLTNPAYAPHCRHEFNDTKHRFVNYTIVATTRYREYFPPEITRDPKNITRVGPAWEEVNILNSARPDAPKILYVVPTFGWETKKIGDQIVSRRCGGGLRVYLDRPWYSSGIGELLGVVVRSGGGGLKGIKGMVEGGGGGNDPLKPLVTDWGMDPLWGSEFPKNQPSTDAFTIATHSQSGLTLDELPGVEVAVAGHPVDFDETRKLWYCDIEIDMGSSYYPFVRLALARYQPDSIPDAHLSRVVLADFAQIAPDRVAAVVFDPKDEKKIGVLVSGVTGINNLFDSPVTYTPGSKTKPEDLANATTGHTIMVAVETRLPGSGPDAPWVPLTGVQSVTLQPGQQVDDKMVWGGEITLPEPPRQPGGKQYRLVITEIETFQNDTGFQINFGAKSIRLGTRVVYADTIPLQ